MTPTIPANERADNAMPGLSGAIMRSPRNGLSLGNTDILQDTSFPQRSTAFTSSIRSMSSQPISYAQRVLAPSLEVNMTDFSPVSSELPERLNVRPVPSSLYSSSGRMTGGLSSPSMSVLTFRSKKPAMEGSSISNPTSRLAHADS